MDEQREAATGASLGSSTAAASRDGCSRVGGGTTHISAVDADGNAASLSISTGAGSGVVVPGTGFALNNMLGEYNVLDTGPLPRPGRRLTSLMTPSIALEDGRPRLVLGSAGSLRLWSARSCRRR